LRAVVQRVLKARVTVDGDTVGQIGPGLLVLLGVRRGDTEEQADKLARKLLALRIFEDDERSTATRARATGRASSTPRRPRRPSRSTSACARR
jgi:D-aminoacyl-tRNA deacylase